MITPFSVSAQLAAMHTPASKEAVVTELNKLLAILGETAPDVIAELANTTVRQNVLAEMAFWNARLAPNNQRDRLGQAATRFWAAQTIATTVMRSKSLDQAAAYPQAVAKALAGGPTACST
jgi:hypothetical protein